jgi:hypothetical protein
VVLCARPSVGAVTLALLFGLFNLTYGTWMPAGGIELRRTGKTLRPVPSLEGIKSNSRALLATTPSQILGRTVCSGRAGRFRPARVLRSADGSLSPAGTRC